MRRGQFCKTHDALYFKCPRCSHRYCERTYVACPRCHLATKLDRDIEAEWIAGVGWCGPDWEEATRRDESRRRNIEY